MKLLLIKSNQIRVYKAPYVENESEANHDDDDDSDYSDDSDNNDDDEYYDDAQFTTPFKDDIRHLARLKQQISQKMILLVQHITLMSLCCEVISYFVIFAVLDLRDGGCRP